MRVLHVTPSVASAFGGPSHAVRAMERALGERGVAVTTVTTDDDGPGRRLAAGARPARVGDARRVYFRKWLDFYAVAPGAASWLWRRARDFDVIHIHALFSFPSVAAGLVARARGVPYIVRPLGTLNAYGMTKRRPRLKQLSLRAVEGPILRRAAAVHFTSEAELREAEGLGIPFRAIVVPLGVTACEGDRERFLATRPDLRGRTIVLYLSRLDPKKNLEGLLEAFAIARARRPDAALVVAGGGSPAYEASIKTLAGRLGLDGHVVWLGHVDGAEKGDALAAAHVFALTSHSENFGVAAVEAMLAGLPCVLSRGVAIAEAVAREDAGLMVAPETDAISVALVRLLEDEGLRRAMGERGRRMAERDYSPPSMADGLIREYERAARAERGREPSGLGRAGDGSV